jgi:hypothetical protein
MDGILNSFHSELFYRVIYSPTIRLSENQSNIHDPPKNIPFVPENEKDLGILRPRFKMPEESMDKNRKCFLKLYPFIISLKSLSNPP